LGTDIYVIPDTQVRPGDVVDHIDWIAKDIVRRKPDVIICLGDWWDFPSLSSHDEKGSAKKENARVLEDLEAGTAAMRRLMGPIRSEIYRLTKNHDKRWQPRCLFLEGNHEYRADRYAESEPIVSGLVGSAMCPVEEFGFERHKFLEPVEVGGVVFSHYWQNNKSSRPIGGTIDNRLNKICSSFVCGHEQGLYYGNRPLPMGRTIHGVVAGSCYLGCESYRGPQAKNEWRGTVVLHDVRNGDFDPMFLTLRYLCREYTGEELGQYMRSRYEGDWSHLE